MAINFLLLGGFQSFILGLLLFFTSLFLIFIVLIQRGRGGGLTGALGGTGQSAFGSRAGDELTYITLVVAGGWIFLCIVCIWVLNPNDAPILDDQDSQQLADAVVLVVVRDSRDRANLLPRAALVRNSSSSGC